VYKNLISHKVLIQFCLSMSFIDMRCSQVCIINSPIKAKGYDLLLGTDLWWANHCCIELMMSGIGPRNRELRFRSQYFIIICKDRVKERAISILVGFQELHNNWMEHL
jgi:hypothetical protein